MSRKVFKYVSSDLQTSEVSKVLDCDRCVLCQLDTDEPLQCPATSKRKDAGAGYRTLSENFLRLKELGCLKSDIDISTLDDGSGLANVLYVKKVKWHKSCTLKYNTTQVQRAEKRRYGTGQSDEPPQEGKKLTRQSLSCKSMKEDICFFCDLRSAPGTLHEVSTFSTDNRIRECAIKLQDTALLAKLSSGDLVAQEAKYHKKCLVFLYNKASRLPADDDSAKRKEESIIHGIALAETISFIDSFRNEENVAPVFKMSDISKKYMGRINLLGVKHRHGVHSTRLMNRILDHFPDIEVHKEGRDNLLAFKDDIGRALNKACSEDYDANYMTIFAAAKLIRRDILNTSSSTDFSPNCQENSVPKILLTFISMLLHGPTMESETFSQPSLSMSQLLMFNTFKSGANTEHYHGTVRETPLPTYVGLMIYCQTRSRTLIDRLFQLGICISYDRVLSISTKITNSLCEHYQSIGMICPPRLKADLFTTAAVDNIDHNPSATTTKDSFHGTGISVFQHTTETRHGSNRAFDLESSSSKRITSSLPESYSNVPPAILKDKFPVVPVREGLTSDISDITQALQEEYRWLQEVEQTREDDIGKSSAVSWGAFHASKETQTCITPALSALLPLFDEQVKSVAMIKHSMTVIKKCVDTLNPGQTPVIAMDQPLYSVAKQIQWNWPDAFGEKHFIIMFGGLHIEMALFKLLGDWLEGSGWTSVLSQAQVVSSGTADGLLKASHVTKTRRSHQVTACALYKLMKAAFDDYVTTLEENPYNLHEWCQMMAAERPHFQYWLITFQLEMTVLLFVKSIRTGDFQLYIDTLTKLIPWFFVLDHYHYARWLPVHVRDMITLGETNPDIENEFRSGNFVLHKTNRRFSGIAIDHAHEQNNALIKSEGGAVGLLESPVALRRWMVAGPEISQMVKDFESNVESLRDKSDDYSHHDHKQSFQKAFVHDVHSLVEVMDEHGNPFEEDSKDILVLDTKDIAPPSVKDTVGKIQDVGIKQYKQYIQERLIDRKVSVFDPIKRNSFPLMRTPRQQSFSKERSRISALKNDCSLFSRLYISCQTRGSDLDEFFAHENQTYPPSLSINGDIRQCAKSELVTKCIEPLAITTDESPTGINTTILDGAAVVNMLRPGIANTFEDYAANIFYPYVDTYLQKSDRVDVVWDVYRSDSLKISTRSKRGTGIRRRIDSRTNIPKKWPCFLRVDDNKSELFEFLSFKLMEIPVAEGKEIVTTLKNGVLSNPVRAETSSIEPCYHEEADTRMMVHLRDAVERGTKKALIRTVDTDVLVLALHAIQALQLCELWILFGTGKNLRYFPVHDLSRALGPEKCRTLPAFHAFTGCDNVSSFGGKGKKTAYDTWMVDKEVTHAFDIMMKCPRSVRVGDFMPLLERFVICMYDRASQETDVNKCRKTLFSSKGRSIELIPPTKDALLQHTKRATLQSIIWGNSMDPRPQQLKPEEFGWVRTPIGSWQPFWTSLPEASSSCKELIHCGCKKGCRGACKCVKSALPCTALCSCNGDCNKQ